MITRRAGRLTPAASVDVAHNTEMLPFLYPFSMISLSSIDNPVNEYTCMYGYVLTVECD